MLETRPSGMMMVVVIHTIASISFTDIENNDDCDNNTPSCLVYPCSGDGDDGDDDVHTSART